MCTSVKTLPEALIVPRIDESASHHIHARLDCQTAVSLPENGSRVCYPRNARRSTLPGQMRATSPPIAVPPTPFVCRGITRHAPHPQTTAPRRADLALRSRKTPPGAPNSQCIPPLGAVPAFAHGSVHRPLYCPVRPSLPSRVGSRLRASCAGHRSLRPGKRSLPAHWRSDVPVTFRLELVRRRGTVPCRPTGARLAAPAPSAHAGARTSPSPSMLPDGLEPST